LVVICISVMYGPFLRSVCLPPPPQPPHFARTSTRGHTYTLNASWA